MEFDHAWRQWLTENLVRGCQPEQLVQTLLQHGFSLASIKAEMKGNFPNMPFAVLNHSNKGIDKADQNVDFQQLADVAITQNANAQQLQTQNAQLYILPDFMSAEECQQTIDLMNKKLRPSEVTVFNGDNAFRTSTTCDLGFQDSEFIVELDNKIADTLGIPVSCSEIIQGQKYQIGQEFKAHTDYFEPNSDEYNKFASELGQRTWTFMVYLNDTEQGGQTHFTRLGAEFSPKRGTAVIWNNLKANGEVNFQTIHHAKPVEQGEKYVITKWFRTKQNPHLSG